MGTVLNLSGNKYGLLTVVELSEMRVKKDGKQSSYWLCRCDCGNEKVVLGSALVCGNTKSCGCIKSHIAKERNIANSKHGARREGNTERLYSIWCGMKRRCFAQSSGAYSRYGGRGIRVCDEWANDYSSFREWAMNNGYSSQLTLDRVDNENGYCPENCRWATRKEQANNRSNNIFLSHRGKEQSIADWAKETGLSYRTIYARVKAGWEVEKALEQPSKRRKQQKTPCV